ncbi:MAG: tail fiber protein [Taibaiella sp.]|nr:tail fiber protein [Taibaiella sp.]
MKLKLHLLLLALFFATFASAQKMNLQGKISRSGSHESGKHYMEFLIAAPGPTWFGTDSVNVVNGYYSVQLGTITNPIPIDLFYTYPERKMLVKFDGYVIDTVTLLAPFERDLRIASYIHDSVSWAYIRGIPVLDTSFSNEIQALSMVGDTLKLSNGGFVLLPNISNYIGDSVTWNRVHNKPTVDTSFTNELQNLSYSNDSVRISNGNVIVLPSVSGYVRDSVKWTNVRGKPTVDTSFTNEIQTLSFSNDTIRISNGNNIVIPSVSGYVRDSVKWVNVRGKPTVDTSFTNEIQTLSLVSDTLRISNSNYVRIPGIVAATQTLTLTHDTLKISNGNYVLLPKAKDTLSGTVINGKLTVIDTSTTSLVSTIPGSGSWFTFPASPLTGIWQSFKATGNGKLKRINVYMASSTGSVLFTFYNGQGTTTPSIISPITLPCPIAFGLCSFDVSSFNLTVTSGSVYTFCFVPSVGGQVTALLQGDVYSSGIEGTFIPSSSSTTTNYGADLAFSVEVDNTMPPRLTFNSTGYVGIGTSTPTAQLEVKGRVKDQTGFLMPVGSVIAFAGRNIPEGWLLCDGRAISRTTYADLFQEIDTLNGHGDMVSTFNIPDCRGQFLRGVDNSPNVGPSGTDPDRSIRTPAGGAYGGNSGNSVGSKQDEAIKQHTHQIQAQGNAFGRNGIVPPSGFWSSSGDVINSYGATLNTVSPNPSLSNETRPKNTYVYYIIKY